MNTRKMFVGAATVLAGLGLLGACTPAPTPSPVVPPTGPTDTKTFGLVCTVSVPSAGITTTSTNNATITLTGTDPTDSGTGIDFTVDITGGIKNGPLPSTGGTVEAYTSLNGAAEVLSTDVAFGATGASQFVVVPQLSGTSDPIAAESTLHLTRLKFEALGASGNAYGNCGIAAGDQPAILIGIV